MKNNNISLNDLLNKNEILSVGNKDISKFARVRNIGQLISLANGQKIKGINNEKIVNTETVTLAKYILEKISIVLGYDPHEIKDKDVFGITLKIGEEISKIQDIESYIIGNYIKKVAFQVKNIHLRYERLLKQKENSMLEKDSNRDHLTGLLNRRAMELFLENAISNKKRHGENYGIIILDIDFFKRINDNYGHNIGDLVIQELGNILGSFFRDEDKICRWGGEEFLILMKGGNDSDYIKKIEKLRLFIQDNLVNIINKKIASYGYDSDKDEDIKEKNITISIGITSLNENDDIKSGIKRADDGLYLAKEGGRNKIIYRDCKENDII